MKTVLALALTLCAPSTAIAADAPVEPRLPPRALALEALAAMADAAADGPGGEAVFSGAYDGSRSEPRVVRAAFGGFTPPPPPPPVLTPPSLNPGLGGVSPAPRVEEPVAATPTPREPQTARPSPAEPGSSGGGGGAGVTPCQDLRAKAARLETAAELCRRDISAGAPYCHVTIPYDSPSIPKTLSPGEADGYAARFRQVASQGDERACRDYGGEGVVPYATPTQSWILRGLAAVYDTRANVEVKAALTQFVLGRDISGINYDQDSYWTQAMSRHYHMDSVRDNIRAEYRNGRGNRSGYHHYSLNNFSLTENIRILLRDIMASVFGFNMAYTTGSVRFKWNQVGGVDYFNRRVTVLVTAEDSLRLQSLTRIPTTDNHLLPDNYFGQWGPMHNVPLKWQWTETLYY